MDMSFRLFLQLCVILAGVPALAQPSAKLLEFEIASVKPADPSVRISNVLPGAGESLTIVNVPLRKIILYAYDIRDFQLSGGPGWIADERYDIIAKPATADHAPFGAVAETDEQRKIRVLRVRERLQSLLSNRFGLRVHVEEREQTILALRICEGRPKTPRSSREHRKGQHAGWPHSGIRRPHFHARDTAFDCNRVDSYGRNRSDREV
jgi:uncharacterized protein (TIGR03435 family)